MLWRKLPWVTAVNKTLSSAQTAVHGCAFSTGSYMPCLDAVLPCICIMSKLPKAWLCCTFHSTSCPQYICCMTARQELHEDVVQMSKMIGYEVISIHMDRCGVFVSSDLLCPLAELPVLASHLAPKQASGRNVAGTGSETAPHRVP